MAHLLDGLPVEVLGRLRSGRAMRKPVPRPWICPPQGGRPPKHGKEFRFAKPDTWGEPDPATVQVTDRYGTARTMAWDRIHARPTTRSAWLDHDGELLIIEGTLIRTGGRPPARRRRPAAGAAVVLPDGHDRRGRRSALAGVPAPIRPGTHLPDGQADARLDPPEARTPDAADRWTWLIITAHTQLRLGAHSSRTSAAPGNGPQSPAGSPPHASAEGSGGAVASAYHTRHFTLVPRLKKAPRVPTPADRGPGRPWRPDTPPPASIDPDLQSADIRIGYARCSPLGHELDSQLDTDCGPFRLLGLAGAVRLLRFGDKQVADLAAEDHADDVQALQLERDRLAGPPNILPDEITRPCSARLRLSSDASRYPCSRRSAAGSTSSDQSFQPLRGPFHPGDPGVLDPGLLHVDIPHHRRGDQEMSKNLLDCE